MKYCVRVLVSFIYIRMLLNVSSNRCNTFSSPFFQYHKCTLVTREQKTKGKEIYLEIQNTFSGDSPQCFGCVITEDISYEF